MPITIHNAAGSSINNDLSINSAPSAIPLTGNIRGRTLAHAENKQATQLFRDALSNECSNVARVKQRKLRLSISPEPEANIGKLIGRGLSGEVREDVKNPGYLIKSLGFNQFDNAREEARLFRLVYGEHSAEAFQQGQQTYIRMLKVPGIPLKDISRDSLPENARTFFTEMIMHLGDCGIIHGDLHTGNILYDEANQRFWPIDLSNASDSYFSLDKEGKAFFDTDYEKRFTSIMKKIINH